MGAMKNKHKTQPKPGSRQPRPQHERPRETRDVALTILAVCVSVWARSAWLSPLVLTAPLAFYLARGAAADIDSRDALARRWSITVFITTMAAAALATPFALDSTPFAAELPLRIEQWLAGDGGPVLGARYMLVAGLATLILTAASAGIVGAMVLASILTLNAVAASLLISRGYNIVQMAFVAVSPWQWCFMVGLIALYTPLSVLSRERVLSREGAPFVWQQHRKRVLVGAGLIILAFVLRVALATPYVALVRHWTM